MRHRTGVLARRTRPRVYAERLVAAGMVAGSDSVTGTMQTRMPWEEIVDVSCAAGGPASSSANLALPRARPVWGI